jgi:hypothetical protein
MIVRAASDKAWLESRCGIALLGDLRALEAVDDDGTILAMVGFDDWGMNCVKVHFAADKVSALPIVGHAAAQYVFDVAKRKYVFAWTPALHRKAMRWKDWAGFREVYRLKDGYADGNDLVFSVLTKEDCVLLKESANG